MHKNFIEAQSKEKNATKGEIDPKLVAELENFNKQVEF